MRAAQSSLEVVLAGEDRILICYALSEAAGRVALFVGDLATAERYLAMLRDHSAMLRDYSQRHGLSSYYNINGDWINGALLLERGDFVAGLQLLRTAFDELSEAGLIGLFMPFLGPMAEGLGANRKTKEGDSHPDRDAQFAQINAQVAAALADQQPVISVDTKKRNWSAISAAMAASIGRKGVRKRFGCTTF